METVNKLWLFGGQTKECLQYLQYLHDHGFPTGGIYAPDGELVGFSLTNSEMYLRAGYVKSEYRNRHFLNMINFYICDELRKRGQNLTAGFIAPGNTASQKSVKRLGGDESQEWRSGWVFYLPEDPPEDDSVLRFCKNTFAQDPHKLKFLGISK